MDTRTAFLIVFISVAAFDIDDSLAASVSEPPAWARSAIWYQVFVERFRNGDPSNDPRPEYMQGAYPGLIPPNWEVSPWNQDWYEQDLRVLVRRDRNCPSVIMWSYGNEVGEQYTDQEGEALANRLHDILKEEDPTRPTTSAMNWAKPHMPFSAVMDIISLNYQGQGIRQSPEFEGTKRIRTKPHFPAFHQQFPDKIILSSEAASAFSSRS